jgi:hypothetical protein
LAAFIGSITASPASASYIDFSFSGPVEYDPQLAGTTATATGVLAFFQTGNDIAASVIFAIQGIPGLSERLECDGDDGVNSWNVAPNGYLESGYYDCEIRQGEGGFVIQDSGNSGEGTFFDELVNTDEVYFRSDNVTFTQTSPNPSVPEPASALMFATAVAGLMIANHQKKCRANPQPPRPITTRCPSPR